jgi:hypothetical protein
MKWSAGVPRYLSTFVTQQGLTLSYKQLTDRSWVTFKTQ